MLAGLIGITLLTGTRIGQVDHPLREVVEGQLKPVAPGGIVSYELAGNEAYTNEILTAWEQIPGALAAAQQSLWLDFLYLVLYSTTIAYLCYLAAMAFNPGSSEYRVGIWLMYAQWLAAIFDAFENIALLIMLKQGQAVWPLSQVAFWLASLKFLLIILGLAYVLIGLLIRARNKVFNRKEKT